MCLSNGFHGKTMTLAALLTRCEPPSIAPRASLNAKMWAAK